MIVDNPWELLAFTQQLQANLRPSDRTGFSIIDCCISPKQEALLRQQVNVFMALESGEPVVRFPKQEKGG